MGALPLTLAAGMIIPLDRYNPEAAVGPLVRHLRRRGAAVIPTETQFALAADATNAEAVERVRQIKGRGPGAPFTIFLTGVDDLARWRIGCPPAARTLAAAFWPGPLTLILPTANPIFKLLGGDGRSVGVRVSPEPLIARLLARLGHPLLATSANPSGVLLDPRAENRWLVQQAQARRLVWARPTRYRRRAASTIVDCTGSRPRQLRPGPVTQQAWNDALRRAV